MKIRDIYAKGKPVFSFEFFPPKNEEGEKKLFEAVGDLKKLAPAFVSVTYGAMGSTCSTTLRIVSEIKNRIGLEVSAHLTCVGHTREEIEAILSQLHQNGVENIMALRGDPPAGQKEFKPVAGGFRYASELVRFIRRHPVYGRVFSLGVAGYPEGHPECRDKVKDLEHLKRKVDEGADAVITQLFFNNRDYFDFAQRARKIGIRIPVVPGLMPVTHGPQIQKFAGMCGAAIPAEIQDAIDRFGQDQAAVEAFGIEYAIRQCRELLDGGAPGIHFYTLNKSYATRRIYTSLSV